MPDTRRTFDPELPARVRQVLAGATAHLKAHYLEPDRVIVLEQAGTTLTLADLIELLERDDYAEQTRGALADKCAALHAQLAEARARVAELEDRQRPTVVRLMDQGDIERGAVAQCAGCRTQISVHGHDGLEVGYVTDQGMRCGHCCDIPDAPAGAR